jgi:hypothetical protein
MGIDYTAMLSPHAPVVSKHCEYYYTSFMTVSLYLFSPTLYHQNRVTGEEIVTRTTADADSWCISSSIREWGERETGMHRYFGHLFPLLQYSCVCIGTSLRVSDVY